MDDTKKRKIDITQYVGLGLKELREIELTWIHSTSLEDKKKVFRQYLEHVAKFNDCLLELGKDSGMCVQQAIVVTQIFGECLEEAAKNMNQSIASKEEESNSPTQH